MLACSISAFTAPSSPSSFGIEPANKGSQPHNEFGMSGESAKLAASTAWNLWLKLWLPARTRAPARRQWLCHWQATDQYRNTIVRPSYSTVIKHWVTTLKSEKRNETLQARAPAVFDRYTGIRLYLSYLGGGSQDGAGPVPCEPCKSFGSALHRVEPGKKR